MSKMFRFLLVMILVFFIPGVKYSYAVQGKYKIKIGTSPVVSTAGIFLAYEKGYFKEQGLDVDIVYFAESGAPMTVLLSTGGLDVGGGNISAGLWSAINQGEGVKLVADKGHLEKGRGYISLLVRKDHVDSGRYKTFSDLKGFKMGITAYGVSQQIAADKFLKAGKLKLKDITFEKMPYAQMNIALENKNLDATIQLEPYLSKAQQDGVAVKVAEVPEVYPDQQSAVILYSSQFISRHPDLAEKFMIAYLKGVRAYEKAFIEGKEKAETIALLKKHIKIESDAVWNNMIPVGLNPNGYLIKESLLEDAVWYKKHGFIEEIPDIEKAVDHSYVKKALDSIGAYQP
jgi:NitT/TauT family transport system substrate-binding protein